MKKSALILVFAILCSFSYAQRFAYVDTDLILKNIPAYQEAQDKLDELSVQWQNEIEKKYAAIDKLYKDYQAEQILLTEEMKRKREQEIIEKERQAKEFQKAKFGVEGELFKKRQELVKPIQDEIYNAIKELAEAGNYAVIFDKAGQTNILFSDAKYDKSEDILKKLGYQLQDK